jgi:hypothetical protein
VFEPPNFATVQYVIRICLHSSRLGKPSVSAKVPPEYQAAGGPQAETKERKRQLMRGNTLQAEAEEMKQIIRLLVIELMDNGGTTPEMTCEVIAEDQPERYKALGPDQMLALYREIHESSDPVESARLQDLFGVFNAKYFSGRLDFAVHAVYDPGLSDGMAIAGWVDFLNRRIYVGLTQFLDEYPCVLLHQMAHASTVTLDDTDEIWITEMRRLGELGAPV